jgi:hypothetical protein
VSMVVTPSSAARFAENFRHILGLGFREIFVMTANGHDWTPESLTAFRRNLDAVYSDTLGLIRRGELEFRNLDEWQAPFRINTELAVSVDGQLTNTFVCCLIREKPEVRQAFSYGPIGRMARPIDEFLERKMTNEEGIPMLFTYAIRTPGWLKNNIEAGMLMTDFVQSLKDDLGRRDGLYERNRRYIQAYRERARRGDWFDPLRVAEVA